MFLSGLIRDNAAPWPVSDWCPCGSGMMLLRLRAAALRMKISSRGEQVWIGKRRPA